MANEEEKFLRSVKETIKTRVQKEKEAESAMAGEFASRITCLEIKL